MRSSLPHRIALSLLGAAILAGTVAVPAYFVLSTPIDGGHALLPTATGVIVESGWKVEEYISPGGVQNPVAITTDERGTLYVAEATGLDARFPHFPTPDSLGLSKIENLAVRTPSERAELFRTRCKRPSGWNGDRISVVRVDGSQDVRRVEAYAAGFADVDADFCGGILAHRNAVWFAQMPNLWRLDEDENASREPARTRLFTGLGLRIGAPGHNLHGLVRGHDGKLYFSLGDVGAHVASTSGTATVADTGAVFRCNLDGTELEVFAIGLRNPQDLAFDELGNLFTVDNDQDPGDESRLIHVVEGGDYGWRCGVLDVAATSWLRERLWGDVRDDQPVDVLPPAAVFAECKGPAGLAYDPGTGVPAEYRSRFLVCNFAYAKQQSGILAPAVRPRGASYELRDVRRLAGNVVPADIEFAPDGSLLIAGWAEGGQPGGACAIYRAFHPEAVADRIAREAQQMLASDWNLLSASELIRRLGHPNLRVRLNAQWEAAARPNEVVDHLVRAALLGESLPHRLHALWSLAQRARLAPEGLRRVEALLQDDDAEMRAQAARCFGDARLSSPRFFANLLADPAPRVRYFAALAVGKTKEGTLIPAVTASLRGEFGDDPFLRHACTTALTATADESRLIELLTDESPNIRLVAIATLRRLRSSQLVAGLTSRDPRIVIEAARGIHDERIAEALPVIAAIKIEARLPDPLIRRILSARRVLGGGENAAALAMAAADETLSIDYRLLAVQALLEWDDPEDFDRVTGKWWNLPPRSPAGALEHLPQFLERLLSSKHEDLVAAGVALARKFAIREVGGRIESMALDSSAPDMLRRTAMEALVVVAPDRAAATAEQLMADALGSPELRTGALEALATVAPPQFVQIAETIVRSGSGVEQQAVWRAIGRSAGSELDPLPLEGMRRLLRGESEPVAMLELLTAARKRETSAPLVREYEASLDGVDRLTRRRASLWGGDAVRGERLFRDGAAEASCVRCHAVRHRIEGGAIGPDLRGLASRSSREEIFESLVEPNRKLAAGYATTVLTLEDGRTLSGVVTSQSGARLTLRLADGRTQVVDEAEIESRDAGASAMPQNVVDGLSDGDLRDLVAFLAELKESRGAAYALRRLYEELPKRTFHDLYSVGLP